MKKSTCKKKRQSLVLKSMRIISFLMIITFFGTLVHLANAQTHFQWGINGQGVFPQGEFKDDVSNIGGGMGLEFTFTPTKMPFGIGASFGYLVYGSEKFHETIRTQNADFNVDVTTTNSIILGHLLFRFQAKQGKMRPYLDGLIGFNRITTDTKIKDPDFWDDGVRTNNIDDTVLSYGGGLGLMIKVYEGFQNKEKQVTKNKKWELLIDLRLRYIRGNEGKYLKEGSIFRVDDELFYDVKKSRTDVITAQLGVSFNF